MSAQQPAEAPRHAPRAAWLAHVAAPQVVVATVLCGVIFTTDVLTPKGVAASIGYVAFVICGLWFTRLRATYILAAIATALTVVAIFFKTPSDVAWWVIAVNRTLGIAALWTMAAMIHLRRRSQTAVYISEKRRHEAESDAAEASKQTTLLAAVVESSNDAMFAKSRDGKIIMWNAGAERVFGYSAREMIGRTDDLIVPPESADEEHLITAEILEGRSIENFETVYIRRDGERRHVSLTVSPVRGADGVIMGTSKVAHDITARKTAEVDLVRHMMALERSNKDLDDFAYIASHDLREPLRGLANNAKFLEDDYEDKLDPNGIKRLHRMGYLTRRMDQLITDLLYFSRLGRQGLAIERTDLNAVIADIATTMPLEEEHAKIEIPSPLPAIVCDRPRVTEMFRNLIGNALKYNDSGEKRIEIGCIAEMPHGNELEHQVFYVRDNGIGIDKEFHDEVFRIFKRLNEEDDGKKGTGVGLTFVRKIVERHGGRIWLESKPGAGTTFYFTLAQKVAHAA